MLFLHFFIVALIQGKIHIQASHIYSREEALSSNLVFHSPFPQTHPHLASSSLSTRKHKRAPIQAFDGPVSFHLSVASGDPMADSAIIWTRASPTDDINRHNHDHNINNKHHTDFGVQVHWQVSRYPDEWDNGATSVGVVTTTGEVDYTVKVLVENLAPFTKYYYRFFSTRQDGQRDISPTGSFKTLPSPDDSVPLGSQCDLCGNRCANYPTGYFNAYGVAANHSQLLDYVLHLGDYTYEYKDGYYGNGTDIGRVPDPPDRECTSLEDYRRRYALYRRDPQLRSLHEKLAFFMTWDDHEIADNTWKGGSSHSNNTKAGYINGVGFDERKANGVRAYYEYTPIRQVEADDHLRIWRTFKIGKLADLIMLDTRQYNRDITNLYYNTDEVIAIKDDKDRSIMGFEQEKWFNNELSQSSDRGAVWRLIAQQVVFSKIEYPEDDFNMTVNVDAWDGYTANRQRVFDHLYENKITNNIVLSGDSHANWVFDLVDEKKQYDPETGSGAAGVEFGGTAISSPLSYGLEKTEEQRELMARRLTKMNSQLKWAEGNHRGYFELSISPSAIVADYISVLNIMERNDKWRVTATFRVDKDGNRISRAPLAVKGVHTGGSFGRGLEGSLADMRELEMWYRR